MDNGIEALIADMKEAALRATPGPWRRTSTMFNGITHGPFSFTKEDVLGHFAEKCNAEFVSGCDPKNVLALIAALEQAQKRNAELEVGVKFPGVMRCPKCDFSRTHINVTPTGNYAGESVPEHCPNGCGSMWHDTYKRQYSELYDHKEQLSNELAEMKRKCVELTVWYGAMPESNGKTNWTAILHRKGECLSAGITIDRSEYPDRVRYEADRIRYLIGELDEKPWITNYDANKHSGYTARKEGE